LQLRPIDPEFADSVELGLKTDLLDDRLRVNVVFFKVDYSDAQRQLNAQIPLPGGGSFQETLFFNAAKLNAKGIEFESTFAVTDQLTLAANFSYQDVDFSKFEADTNFDGTNDVDLSGNKVNRSPPWTAYASATYTHSLGDFGEVTHNMYVSFVDKTIFTYSALGPDFDATTNAHTLLNWSSTFTDKSGNYYARVFGKNLLDERYITGNLSVATLWTMTSYGAPQQFGVEVGAHFDF
jgi:iron complex outermembrane receptor protein